MPTASIKFTPDFHVEAFRRYRRQHCGRIVSFAIKMFALTLLLPSALWMFCNNSEIFGGLLVAFCTCLVFFHQLEYWRVRLAFRRSPARNEEVVIQFNNDGFHASSVRQDTMLKWSAFTRVTHFKDGYLLIQDSKRFYWIPLLSLESPSQVTELEALLRSKIHRHRVVHCARHRASATPHT